MASQEAHPSAVPGESLTVHSSLDLRIHVTGVANPTTIEVIHSYFSTFGGVTSITEYSNRRAQDNDQDNPSLIPFKTGSCVLVVQDLDTKVRILGYPTHCMQGRSIRCSPLKSSQELMEERAFNNARKVLVKKVPSTISQMDLTTLLEERYGPIESVFAFLPDKDRMNRPNKGRSIRTYSVMFKDVQSAEAAALADTFLHPSGCLFIIERFSYDMK